MRKYTTYLSVASAVAMLVASCTKEVNYDEPKPVTGREIPVTVIATGDEATKTELDGTSVKWSADDKIEIIEVATPTGEGEVKTTAKASNSGVSTDGNVTMSFGTSFTEITDATFEYYAAYPSSAYQSNNGVTNVALNTPSSQTPSASSFDPAADLLLAKKIDNGSTQAGTLNMQFARVIGISKMTVKNLASSDPIEKIKFSAVSSGNPVSLAGRTAFNLETGEPVSNYASNVSEKNIILNYEGQNITANSASGMVAYFTSYPFSLGAGDSFTVTVETATQSFTKVINLTGSQALAVNVGKASNFSVNMSGVSGEDKAFSGCYAFVELSDVELSGSYTTVSVTKTHGDTWEMNALSTNGAIGIKNNDAGSYIKLPDFEEDINAVVITLASVSSGKHIMIDNSQSNKSGELADVTTTDDLVYFIDLSSASVKTAYIHHTGGQGVYAKVEVYAGTDTRTALTAPSGVTTALNATVSNSIDVAWEAVSNAGSYVVTLAPAAGDTVIYPTTETSCTVPGLEYNTEYMISVKALPADPYIYKESSEADGADVTTGAESGPQWVKTNIGDITDGSLVVIVDLTSGRAMSNDNGSSSAPAASTISLSGDKSKLSAEPSANLQWTFKVVSGGYSFMTGSDYLTVSNTNNGVRVLSSGRSVFTAYDNEGTTFLRNVSGNDTRYIGVYNNQDWRCYSSINNNIKNTVTAFYVKQGGGSPVSATYSVTVSPTSNGTVTANPSTDLEEDDEVTLTITPDANYELETLTVDGTNVDITTITGNTYSFDMPAHDVTVSATFKSTGGGSTTKYYVKVTSEPSDWSGTYLIVYEDGNIAFDGSRSQDTGSTFAVTISNGQIASTADIDAKSFTIGSMSGGYYLLAACGSYLYGTSGSNKTNYGATASVNTISFDNGDVLITSNTSVLRYNTGSTLFRYYKSSSYTSQKAIQLYKLN